MKMSEDNEHDAQVIEKMLGEIEAVSLNIEGLDQGVLVHLHTEINDYIRKLRKRGSVDE